MRRIAQPINAGQAQRLVRNMARKDEMMLMTFDAKPTLLVHSTRSKPQLRQAIDRIEPTEATTDFREAAAERGFVEVRIIHGRGRGVQRQRVRSALARSPWVEEFSDAPATRGGWGATLVWLNLDRNPCRRRG